jgi:pyruvate dehydrogenase E2 component (dihydrolipoamide acetyltransferase)
MSGDLILMPRLGETMELGTVRAWLVQPGKPFRRGDVIAEIETDKTTVEMPALADGVIAELLAAEGDEIAVGEPLARLAGPARQGEVSEPSLAAGRNPPVLRAAPPGVAGGDRGGTNSASSTGRIRASPAARRLAAKTGLALADVPGTGRNGRRQGWDVRAFAETGRAYPAAGAALHLVERGAGPGLPVVFLHGFGGSVDGWMNIQNAIALHHRTIAIDLPGHGRSVGHPAVSFSGMAAAVADTLDTIGVAEAHFVGHSMGAGVGAAQALARPERVASLTLIAPAGFGPEINRLLLADFAKAHREDDIARLIGQFFGASGHVPRHLPALLARTRGDAAHGEALARVLAAMMDGERQHVLDLEALAATGIPTRILWGDDDRVLPIATADALPAVFALHRFRGVGHMLHAEVPRETIRLIHESIRGE